MDLGQIVKQELGPGPVVRYISEFIQDDDLCRVKFLLQLAERTPGSAFGKQVDQARRTVELYRNLLTACRYTDKD